MRIKNYNMKKRKNKMNMRKILKPMKLIKFNKSKKVPSKTSLE